MSEAKINEKVQIISRINSKEHLAIPEHFTSPLEIRPYSKHSVCLENLNSENVHFNIKQNKFNRFRGSIGLENNNQILKKLTNYNARLDHLQNEEGNHISFKTKLFIINLINKIGKYIYSVKNKSFSFLELQLLNEQNEEHNQQENTGYFIRILWDIIMIIILFIQFITIPLQISFTIIELEYFNLLLLIIFGIDLLSDLYSEKQKEQLCKQYCKKQIIIDLIRIVLLIIVLQLSQKLKITLILQIIYFLFANQKLLFHFQQVSEIYYIEHILGTYKHYLIIIIRFIILAHIIGCLFHQLGQINQDNSWLILNDIIQYDTYQRYLISIEWSCSNLITSNIQYNIINQDEIYFIIFIKLIVIIHFGEIIKNIYNNIQSLNNNISIENQNILQDIRYFFSYYNTSYTLRKRILKYLKTYFIKQKLNQQRTTNFISFLPEILQKELRQEQRLKEIIQCKLLKNFSQQTISKIIEKVELLTLEPNQQILDQKKQDDCSLYIIQCGSVKVYNQFGNSIRIYTQLSNHDSFGQWSFFTGQERQACVKTEEFSKIYKINPIVFRNIISTNMKDLEIFCHIQHQLMYSKQLNYADLRCYGCQSINHMIRHCPHLTYLPDLEKLIIKDNFDKQERQQCRRKLNDRNSHTFLNRPLFLESLKCFRTKNNIPIDISDNEMDESSSQSLMDQNFNLNNQKTNKLETSIQNKWNDQNEEDCVIESKRSGQQSYPSQILRDDDDQEQKINYITIPNSKISQLTLNEQSSKTYLQQRSHKKSAQSNQTSIKQESYSSLVFNEEQIPQIKHMKDFKNRYYSPQTHEQQSDRRKNKFIKQQLSHQISKQTKLNHIDEQQEEENTLNLTNPDDKSLYSPSKQTNNFMYYSNNQKLMKLSSALSSIPKQKSMMTQKVSQLNHSVHNTIYQSILQNINPMQIMDLSQYDKEDEFEIMLNYTVFFPYFNSNDVIQRYNRFQTSIKKQKNIKSNYTLYNSVKKLIKNKTNK